MIAFWKKEGQRGEGRDTLDTWSVSASEPESQMKRLDRVGPGRQAVYHCLNARLIVSDSACYANSLPGCSGQCSRM